MTIKMPDEISITATKLADGRFKLSYIEGYPRKDKPIVYRTARLLKRVLKGELQVKIYMASANHVQARRKGSAPAPACYLLMEGVVSRARVGGLVAAEFLGWSDLGNVTVGQLLSLAGIGAGVASSELKS